MSAPDERGGRYRSASSLERELLTDGRGTADDFPDPFGEHDIEWWVWDGERLIPATVGDMRAIEEYERSRAALRRLEEREKAERIPLHRAAQRFTAIARVARVVRFWRRDTTTHSAPGEPRRTVAERVGEPT